MAVKLYKHALYNQRALIMNPESGLWKYVYADNWSLKDWKKIVEFYKNHKTFTIKVDILL